MIPGKDEVRILSARDIEITVSVVLPIFNEEETIPELYHRLTSTLHHLECSYELIFVNDGSSDQSLALLSRLAAQDPHVRVIGFSRNFGHQIAISAGLDHSRGRAVILMDSDLQDPPEVIPRFVEKWRHGYDVVYAVRRKRKEGWLKRTAYALFYRTMKAVAEIEVPLDAGDFCLLDRRVVDVLVGLPERNRFLRGLRSWIGFSQVGIEYERDGRQHGVSKYTVTKLVRLALAGYIGFSSVPLRVAIWCGFVSSLLGFALILWVIVTKVMAIPSPRGWASNIAVALFLGGVQLLMLGVVGEYISRIYDEVRGRPLYIIRTRLGFGSLSVPEHSLDFPDRSDAFPGVASPRL